MWATASPVFRNCSTSVHPRFWPRFSVPLMPRPSTCRSTAGVFSPDMARRGPITRRGHGSGFVGRMVPCLARRACRLPLRLPGTPTGPSMGPPTRSFTSSPTASLGPVPQPCLTRPRAARLRISTTRAPSGPRPTTVGPRISGRRIPTCTGHHYARAMRSAFSRPRTRPRLRMPARAVQTCGCVRRRPTPTLR